MAELDISTKNCIVEQEGHVLIVTLNRPEAKNAFSPEMLLGMYKAWRLLDQDEDLYCAILTANGYAAKPSIDDACYFSKGLYLISAADQRKH